MSATHPQGDILHLPQNLTVRSINAVHQALLQSIGENAATTLGLEEDCQIDISFVQLVESARIYAGKVGKHISLAEPARGPLLGVLERGGFLEGMSAEDAKFWLHEGKIQ